MVEKKTLFDYYDQCVNDIDIKVETHLLNAKNKHETNDLNEKRFELLNHFKLINDNRIVIFIDYKPSFINDDNYVGKLIVKNSHNYIDLNILKKMIIENDSKNNKNLLKFNCFDKMNLDLWLTAIHFIEECNNSNVIIMDNYKNYENIKFDTVKIDNLNLKILTSYLISFNQLNVRMLDLSCMNIKTIESCCSSIVYNCLKTIDLSSNKIELLPNDCFINLVNLEKLILHDNKIRELCLGCFNGLKQLENLDLSCNYLQEIHLNCLVNLKFLNLNNNEIFKIRTSTFNELNNLKILSISSNRLTNIDKFMFKGLDSLEELYLNSNTISKLESESLDCVKKLKKLDLSSNNLEKIDTKLFNNLNMLKTLIIYANPDLILAKNFFHKIKSLQVLISK